MNTRGVEAFTVVAQTRNMNQAATILNQAQSTISKRIKQLEEEIGTVLFDRSKGTRIVRLTPAGEAFVDIADRWLAVDREATLLSNKEQQLSISIGALDTHGPLIMKCSSLLAARHPRLSVTIYSLHSDTMYEAVERKKIDIGLSTIQAAYPGIKVEPYFSDPMVGACRRTSPLASLGTVDISMLDPRYEIYVPWSVGYRIWHERHFDPRQSSRVTLVFTSLLADMLTTDSSWLILPASFARLCFDRERLVSFRINPEPPDRACFKLTRRNARPLIQRAVDIVESYLEAIIQEEFGPNRDGRDLPDQEVAASPANMAS
ncbi:MAG: LysR family transcriptional regulator [Syntrophobacter sp.]